MLVIKTQRINLIYILGIVAIGLILTTPAIIYGVFNGHDLLLFHLKWSKYFAEQFWTGDLYPRWLRGMNAGLGSPTFFFYAPIPYYFSSLFHPLFANETQGWFQLSLSASLALVASGITAYIWLKNITNQNSAFIASILYMVLPYHLVVDLYLRFALAEYWTFVWIPLILYFSKKIISGHKLNIIGFAVSYALLIMTHLPTLVIFSPVPICYMLSMAGRRQRKKVLIRMFVALILGVGLSAIYWLPAMTTQQYVSMDAITQGKYYYANLFLFLNQIYAKSFFWRYLEIMTLLMGGLACCAFIITRNHPLVTLRQESNYWIATAMIAFFMTLPLSKPVWDVLPVVQRVQFSWRFDSVLTVATTALIALGIYSLESPIFLGNLKKISIGILLITSIVLSIIEILIVVQPKLHFSRSYNIVLFAILVFIILMICSLKQPVNFSKNKPLFIAILLIMSLLLSSGITVKTLLHRIPQSDVDTALQVSMDGAEYRPRWVPQNIFQSSTISQLGRSAAKASVTVGQGSLSIRHWKPREIVLQTNGTTDLWLTINQFYYPGWKARINGESQLLPVQPSKPEGLLRVEVPSGKHEVIVTLDAGVQERIGQLTSAVAGLTTLLLGFWFRTARHKRDRLPTTEWQ